MTLQIIVSRCFLPWGYSRTVAETYQGDTLKELCILKK